MRVEIEKFYKGSGSVVESKPVKDELYGLLALEDVAKRVDLNSDYAGYVRDGDKTLYILNIYQSANSPLGGSWSITKGGSGGYDVVESYRVERDETTCDTGRMVCRQHNFWRAYYEDSQDCPFCGEDK